VPRREWLEPTGRFGGYIKHIEVGPSSAPWEASMGQFLSLAADEADQLKSRSIEPEHLLLAVLRQEWTPAADVITACGVDLDHLYSEILRALGAPLRNRAVAPTVDD
jgi:ATP-dependent Clp protease ATP-binding subunit ClpA